MYLWTNFTMKNVSKSRSGVSIRHKFPIEGLKWLPYVIGIIFGIFNLIYWLIQLVVGVVSKDKHKYIDYTFHEVTYYYGLVIIGFILLAIIIASFFLSIIL